MEPPKCLREAHVMSHAMNSQHDHEELLHLILHSTYRSSSSGSSSSVHLTLAEKQTLLLTLQQVSKSISSLINSNCKGLLSITVGKFGANTPEAWLARHGHLLAELHVSRDVVHHQQQLAAIARGLQAANARPGGLQLQVFTGPTRDCMAAVLAELQGSSQDLTRLELHFSCRPLAIYDGTQHRCRQAVKELLPQLPQLRALTLKMGTNTRCSYHGETCVANTITVAHLCHLTSLNLVDAFVSPSEALPSSLQQLQLKPKPVTPINPLMQFPAGLRSVQLNLMSVAASSERQQLLGQLKAQCTCLNEVKLQCNGELEVGEMAAWATLPVCSLTLTDMVISDQQAAQLFPQLLSATHRHLTELHLESWNVEAVTRLPVSLAQLTGLRKLHLDIAIIPSSSERQQLLEQLAAHCAEHTILKRVDVHYSSLPDARSVVSLERGEMAAWALLPVHSLDLSRTVIPDSRDVQLLPELLAATNQHLTKLTIDNSGEYAVEMLHVGLAQLTGLHTLDLSVYWSLAPSGVEQLCEVVAAQLVNLNHLTLSDMHVSHASVQHLSAARSLTAVGLNGCSWDDGVDAELWNRFEEPFLVWESDYTNALETEPFDEPE